MEAEAVVFVGCTSAFVSSRNQLLLHTCFKNWFLQLPCLTSALSSVENKPASLLVISLDDTIYGMPLLCKSG